MPIPRRRSARLAGAATKSKAAPNLSSVTEHAESPERVTEASTDAAPSPGREPATPTSSVLKPPHDEMHPSKTHPTTGEPSSALRLGFSDIKDANHGLPPTPSRRSAVPSSSFTFRVAREATDVELSSDAQKIMEELRGEAAKIKEDLASQKEAEGDDVDAQGRKIAKPKGKSGRFSAAHMAEFKKMDSIENHASAWRAREGRFTPVVSLKRSPSKANLDSTPNSQKTDLKRSPSKANLQTTPVSQTKRPSSKSSAATPTTPRLKPGEKRSSTRANLDEYQQSPSPKKTAAPASMKKPQIFQNVEQRAPAKRLKARLEDDISAARPVSRDGTSIPRPALSAGSPIKQSTSKAALARLLSPTKASLARAAPQGKPTTSLLKSPSKSDISSGPSNPQGPRDLAATSKDMTPRRRIVSPGRFDRVKSILRGQRTASGSVQTAIPQPAVSQTPAPPKIEKALPPVPLTTPRRKLTKHVAFTPEVTRILKEENSPSPMKTGNRPIGPRDLEDVQFTGIDSVLAKSQSEDIVYPDLSGFRPLPLPPVKEDVQPPAPGTFTFRSDHTIKFGDSSANFGASPGQSSIRKVRESVKPNAEMPGSFPAAPKSHPNKENKAPASPSKMLWGAPHGMSNKKRHRAKSDEEESEKEAGERASKKRKNDDVPEGHAVFAPRLFSTPGPSAKKVRMGTTPSKAPASASPVKKRMLSVSRLNMLARPKNRS